MGNETLKNSDRKHIEQKIVEETKDSDDCGEKELRRKQPPGKKHIILRNGLKKAAQM